ncbi:type I-E CRISPR-associated endoribonuclease Cas2e [Actinobaculum massiliense]|nr:type I-E CRISPR-associated endoribonuclease Cas2e [Actinobaculum massiliense]MDK8319713.1 type I-E CRISPR-associated endoribonuclease Cas2e [Actinobaculum massiliense]MDK8566906.1 type I-E CRISPR-associated endoribonuclease Cas2e [Actinobaculum massiliense]
MVLVLTAAPASLRGDLTKWLLEISAGVFVGNPSARIRELIWARTKELCQNGKAIMVHSAAGEQHLHFDVYHHEWEPTDFDGLVLMKRPCSSEQSRTVSRRGRGWSAARRMYDARSPKWASDAEGHQSDS